MPPVTTNAPVVVLVEEVILVDVETTAPLTNNCVSIVAVPYILVPVKSFAIFYLFIIY
jgi:hypothetical protein